MWFDVLVLLPVIVWLMSSGCYECVISGSAGSLGRLVNVVRTRCLWEGVAFYAAVGDMSRRSFMDVWICVLVCIPARQIGFPTQAPPGPLSTRRRLIPRDAKWLCVVMGFASPWPNGVRFQLV